MLTDENKKLIKEAQKLILLKNEPAVAIFDELEAIRKAIEHLERIEVVATPSNFEREILAVLKQINAKEPEKIDLSRVEKLLSDLLTKEKQPDQITVELQIV